MVDHSDMPSALQVAQAVSAVLGKKLADQSASEIVLTREEAALCLGLAEARGARDLWIGVNALDYSGYPDCRPEFIRSFEAMANLATKAGVEGDAFTVHTPLLHMSKADIATQAARLGLDAGMSWSCYDPTADNKACGKCDSCRLRAKGFADAGLVDPTIYA